MSDKIILDIATLGATLLGGGAGFRFVVGGVKLFLKDVLPIIKQQPAAVAPKDTHCMYHDSIGELIKEFKESSTILIRIEVRFEEFAKFYSEHVKLFDEIFNRLRSAETEIAVLREKAK